MVAYACDLGAREVEAEKSGVQDQPGIHNTLSQKGRKKRRSDKTGAIEYSAETNHTFRTWLSYDVNHESHTYGYLWGQER